MRAQQHVNNMPTCNAQDIHDVHTYMMGGDKYTCNCLFMHRERHTCRGVYIYSTCLKVHGLVFMFMCSLTPTHIDVKLHCRPPCAHAPCPRRLQHTQPTRGSRRNEAKQSLKHTTGKGSRLRGEGQRRTGATEGEAFGYLSSHHGVEQLRVCVRTPRTQHTCMHACTYARTHAHAHARTHARTHERHENAGEGTLLEEKRGSSPIQKDACKGKAKGG